MSKYTKNQAVKIITECAEKYRDELVDRTLLFVCADKHNKTVCYEFSFYAWNYMHLTGVKAKKQSGKQSAMDFYNRCLAHKLSPNEFEFSDDGTTHMKLEVLPTIMCKNLNAKMIGAYNSRKPYLYTDKIAGGTKACVGFVADAIQGRYVPNTLLKDDIRNNVHAYVRVMAVFRKDICESKYTELTYCAKNVEWDKVELSKEFEYLYSLLY